MGPCSCMNKQAMLSLFTPLIGSTFGAFIAYHNNISVFSFFFNFLAIVLGIPLALFLGLIQILLQRYLIFISLLALGFMTASLLSLDIRGVHRWLTIGSIYINISMVLVPLLLFSISKLLDRYQFFSILLTFSVSLLHVMQPDAGQATAFGCAAIVIFLLTDEVPLAIRLMGIVAIATGIILAWYQPDALPAVEHVEHILQLANQLGGFGLAGTALSIGVLFVPIFYTLKHQKNNNHNKVLTVAFMVYLVTTFSVTKLGNYPVPIIGAGASAILGYYVIIGLTLMSYEFKRHLQCLKQN